VCVCVERYVACCL